MRLPITCSKSPHKASPHMQPLLIVRVKQGSVAYGMARLFFSHVWRKLYFLILQPRTMATKLPCKYITGKWEGELWLNAMCCVEFRPPQSVTVAFAVSSTARNTNITPSFISILLYLYAVALLYMGSDIQYSRATQSPHNLPCTCVWRGGSLSAEC